MGEPAVASGFNDSNSRSLYVGSLSERVSEALLWEIFCTVGRVETLKIIRDKQTQESLGYGFVDYFTHFDAMQALTLLNGVEVYGSSLRVNWALAGGQRDGDTASHHHIFIGDLSHELSDVALKEAFKPYGSISDARVMFDKDTGKTRGYGFVSFREKSDAERAIREMNGQWLGNKAIRVNWANQKPVGTTGTVGPVKHLDYETVMSQATQFNLTVYIGGCGPDTTEEQIKNEFISHGPITEVRVTDKGYAFVVFQQHESAARAIVANNGLLVGGRQIRCSWGKEKDIPRPVVPTPYGGGFPGGAPYGAPPPGYGAPPGYPAGGPPPGYGQPPPGYGPPGGAYPQYR